MLISVTDKSGNLTGLEKLGDARNSERNTKWFSEIFDLIPKNSQDALRYDSNCLKTWLRQNPSYQLNSNIENNENVLKLYFQQMIDSDLKRATIVRHKASIKKLLKVMSLANPLMESSLFGDWLKVALNVKPASQKQAEGMDNHSLSMLNIKLTNNCAMGFRNKLIFNISFDALLRASEVCAIKVEHIDFNTETIFIPSSKTDQSGKGEYLYLSGTTLALISEWTATYSIHSGYLLRSLSPNKNVRSSPLKYRTVLDAFRSASTLVGKPYGFFTGHSGRVGGAITLAEQGASLFEIQRNGRWANSTMPVLYTKKASAKITGMGRVSKNLGR